MVDSTAKVRSPRVLVSFLAASTIPALIFSLFILLPNGSQSYVYRLSVAAPIWAIAAVYGYMATAVFGVPIYLLLKCRFVLSPLTCCVSGAFIACLPLLSLNLLIFLSGGQSGFGTPGFALLAILGAVGGITFWAVAFSSAKPLQSDTST